MSVRFSSTLVAICLSISSQACQAQSQTVAMGSRPVISSDRQGQLHAAFEAYKGAAKVPDIFYTASRDHGTTWLPPKNISMTPGVSEHADIAVEKSGAIDVVWTDTTSEPKTSEIFFVRSADGGQTWTKPEAISGASAMSSEPALAVGPDDGIHIVWSSVNKGETNKEIFYVCSNDGGKKWSAHRNISVTPGASYDPTIAVGANGHIHAAWADNTPGPSHPDIYYALCRRGAWTLSRNLSRSTRISTRPSLACGRGNVYLTWSDNSRKETAPDIWLAVGNSDGKFMGVLNMSDTPGVSTEPRAAAVGDDLAIVWSDTSTGTETPSIYGIATHDGGADFSSWMNVSRAHDMAKHPDVTISAGKMHAIWEEIAGDNESTIKTGIVDIKGLATGPPLMVDPKLHGVSGNMH